MQGSRLLTERMKQPRNKKVFNLIYRVSYGQLNVGIKCKCEALFKFQMQLDSFTLASGNYSTYGQSQARIVSW